MKTRSIAAVILLAGFGVMLAVNAPGQLSYDSVTQLADGRSGAYNSWHPPVMAWLLGLFDAAIPGTFLFLLFQSTLLLLALLALVWTSPRPGRGAVLVAALIVLTPQWLLYQGEIWKDVLFADAAIAGFAALAVAARDWQRRALWLTLAVLLLGLAAATRQNGLVLLPVAAIALGMIAHRLGKRGWIYGLGFLIVTLALGAGASAGLAARGDGGDGATAQIRLGQSYDLAGALAHDPALPLPVLAAQDKTLEAVLRGRGPALWSPLRNDPFAADPSVSAAISNAPLGVIAAQWRQMVLDHPLLYAQVRLAVFWRVLRTPGPQDCRFVMVGVAGPPGLIRQLGLTAGARPQDKMLGAYAHRFVGTPVFSHLAWGALALLLMVLLLRRGDAAGLAMAGLLAGALLFALTFAIISIACDYRYLVFLDLSVMAGALHLAGDKWGRRTSPTG